jgi:twitching motility protein PilT
VARKYAHKIPFLVKLNHNELLTYPNNYDQIMFAGVKQAADLGAVAVGATIYYGSEESNRQIQEVSDAFAQALRYILRQDPDVVLVGELRDLETVASSLTVAETGHLTMATLHTNSCAQTINRIIDIFPSHQQPQIRSQLSFVLEGVISQRLLPRSNGKGRVLALEILIPNPAIRNLIREDKVHQIYSQMQVGQSKFSMQTMNQSLANLYQRGQISFTDALSKSTDPAELRQMIGNLAF